MNSIFCCAHIFSIMIQFLEYESYVTSKSYSNLETHTKGMCEWVHDW